MRTRERYLNIVVDDVESGFVVCDLTRGFSAVLKQKLSRDCRICRIWESPEILLHKSLVFHL